MDPIIGEIRMWAGTFAPLGWAFCHGQLLPIAQNWALFSVLGTTYGGDGQTTFALPDLRGRVPLGQGIGPGLSPRMLGEVGGAEAVTLTSSNLPPHHHAIYAATEQTTNRPAGNAMVAAPGAFGSGVPTEALAPTGATGSGAPHTNMPPFQAINFIIAIEGTYPTHP